MTTHCTPGLPGADFQAFDYIAIPADLLRSSLYKRLSLLRGDSDEIPEFHELMARTLTQEQGSCRAWSVLRKWNLTSTSCYFALSPLATALADDALTDDFSNNELQALRALLDVIGSTQTPAGQALDEGMEDALDDGMVKSKSKAEWIALCKTHAPTTMQLGDNWPPVSWSRAKLVVWLQRNTEWEGGQRVSYIKQLYRRLHRAWFAKPAQSRAMSRGLRNEARALGWVLAMMNKPSTATTSVLERAFGSPNAKVVNAFHAGLIHSKASKRTSASPDAILVIQRPTGSDVTCVWECKTRSGADATQCRQALKHDLCIDNLVYIDLDNPKHVKLFQQVVMSEANRMQVVHLATVIDVDFVVFTECTTRDLIYSAIIRCSDSVRSLMESGFLHPLHRLVVTPLVTYLSTSNLTSFTAAACDEFGFPPGEAESDEAYYTTFALHTALLKLASEVRAENDVPLPRCDGLKSMAVSQWDTYMGAVDINTQLAKSLSGAFVRVGMYYRLWTMSLATCLVSLHKVMQIVNMLDGLKDGECLSDLYPTMRLLRADQARKATLLETVMELYKHLDIDTLHSDTVSKSPKTVNTRATGTLALLGPTSITRPRLQDEHWNTSLRDARSDAQHTAVTFTRMKVDESTGRSVRKSTQRMCRAPGCCARCRIPVPPNLGPHFHPELEHGFEAAPDRMKVSKGCLECGAAYSDDNATTDASIAFPLCTSKGRWNIEVYTSKGWEVTESGLSCWDAHHSGVMYPSNLTCCPLPEVVQRPPKSRGRPSQTHPSRMSLDYPIGTQRLQLMMLQPSSFDRDRWDKEISKAATRALKGKRRSRAPSGTFSSTTDSTSATVSSGVQLPKPSSAPTVSMPRLKPGSTPASLDQLPISRKRTATSMVPPTRPTSSTPASPPTPISTKPRSTSGVTTRASSERRSKEPATPPAFSSLTKRRKTEVSVVPTVRVTRAKSIRLAQKDADTFIDDAVTHAVQKTRKTGSLSKTVHRSSRDATVLLNETVDAVNQVVAQSEQKLPRLGLRSGDNHTYDLVSANLSVMRKSGFRLGFGDHPKWFEKSKFTIVCTVTDHYAGRGIARSIAKWIRLLGGRVRQDFNYDQIGHSCGYLAARAAIEGIRQAPLAQTTTVTESAKLKSMSAFTKWNVNLIAEYNVLIGWDSDYNNDGSRWLRGDDIIGITHATLTNDLLQRCKDKGKAVPGPALIEQLTTHQTNLLVIVASDGLPITIIDTFEKARNKALTDTTETRPHKATVINCIVSNTDVTSGTGFHWLSVNLHVTYSTSPDTDTQESLIVSP